jgi:hypothetical protein
MNLKFPGRKHLKMCKRAGLFELNCRCCLSVNLFTEGKLKGRSQTGPLRGFFCSGFFCCLFEACFAGCTSLTILQVLFPENLW